MTRKNKIFRRRLCCYEKMKECLFSYGTLQKEKVQIDLFGRILAGSADILRGYKISTLKLQMKHFFQKVKENTRKLSLFPGPMT